ncbi:carboxymuconolactone decarboxylase [Mycobacterium kubicae]|uniref:Carboxymuconolactone decarboxylase n=1 Tax=Mycobacterium kubicae TaxID=120959 RepID=A0AAX1J9J2_9MYCO|nr:carboxymuconolactone decarboxylase family protein [Mycobacterium kubicae]MCV7096247.1 carboxymuconolactone decarboxylase family protein [Mycobacterium kubicae]ORV95562.1 carboxymuconolactone decarboxylase [Mycobacterium kubicae]QNI13652.1 carboxymuconolactone decarboxylase family protein [Mycobacterium kubicae]QPI37170.1 carboxymuconolactone decarboxylase family protein [Mycobacterium kubicae]GFG66745.1 carboxymuconolactone decarboxylase [Mycobacterium kubicae]
MRLPPLPADQWDESVQQALSGMLPEERRNPRDASNVLATMVNHPALTKAFLKFNLHLLYSSTLPPRLRELAILRVAHRRDCTYEWTHHVDLAKREGITDEEIDAVRQPGGAHNLFDEFERTVISGVDELDEKSELSDQTWATLGERLDDRQRMDYVFTVGSYTMLAMALNTFGVQVEADHEGR